MKRILCYGDSNTFGTDGKTGQRFPYNIRWPGALQMLLGEAYRVIEEGLGGRTTVWDDPIEMHKNGRTYLMPCLHSHMPLDLVIIMLGTNDLKKRFDVPACDIAGGMEVLINDILISRSGRGGTAPKMLLIAPVIIEGLTELADILEGGVEKSKQLPVLYRNLAKKYGTAFFDSNDAAKPCTEDGVHLDAQGHGRLAEMIRDEILTIL
jgi:lysophospholipase L1-like esterase